MPVAWSILTSATPGVLRMISSICLPFLREHLDVRAEELHLQRRGSALQALVDLVLQRLSEGHRDAWDLLDLVSNLGQNLLGGLRAAGSLGLRLTKISPELTGRTQPMARSERPLRLTTSVMFGFSSRIFSIWPVMRSFSSSEVSGGRDG